MSCLGPGLSSEVLNVCKHLGPHAQKGTLFGLAPCCHNLENLHHFWRRSLHFNLALDPTNYVVSPSWTEGYPKTQDIQCWTETVSGKLGGLVTLTAMQVPGCEKSWLYPNRTSDSFTPKLLATPRGDTWKSICAEALGLNDVPRPGSGCWPWQGIRDEG